jgi:hypothetical protein
MQTLNLGAIEMTFGPYAQRQLFFEPELNTAFTIGKYVSDTSAVLRNFRMRYIITDNFTDDFSMVVNLVDFYDDNKIIDTSAALLLADFVKPAVGRDFHQGWIRLDFTGTKTLAIGNMYLLQMIYTAGTYTTSDTRFIMFAIDYPFRTYDIIGSVNPFVNAVVEGQIFTERLYDDFVVR